MTAPVRPSGATNTTLADIYTSTGKSFNTDVSSISSGEYRYPEPIARSLATISKWIDDVTVEDDDDAKLDAEQIEGEIPATCLPLETAFTNLTLASGWSHYPAGQVAKDKFGFVHLQGRVTNPSYPSGFSTTVLICTLGSGYRPAAERVFPVRGGYIQILTDGKVNILSGSTSYSPFLDGISFYVG